MNLFRMYRPWGLLQDALLGTDYLKVPNCGLSQNVVVSVVKRLAAVERSRVRIPAMAIFFECVIFVEATHDTSGLFISTFLCGRCLFESAHLLYACEIYLNLMAKKCLGLILKKYCNILSY